MHNGILDQVKENMGHCTSSKVPWINLENYYQNKEQATKKKKSNNIEEQNTYKQNSHQNKE